MLAFASVCSGIGVPELAWQSLDWRCAFMSEIEKFPRAVLEQRFGARDVRRDTENGIPLFDDLTAIRVRHLRRLGIPIPNLLVAGTPCQAFSIAGARRSLSDDRGNLTLEFVRLVHALRNADKGFRWLVWENVPGVLNTKDNAFGCFLAGIVGGDGALRSPLKRGRWPGAGMVAGPFGRAAWRVLDAQHFGVPQRRRRVFVVAGFGDRADPAKILFEPHSMCGDSPEGEEKESKIAGAVTSRLGTGGAGDNGARAGHLIPHLSRTVTTREGQRLDLRIETFITHTLRGEGFDASEDGTGRGTPLVALPVIAFGHNKSASQTMRVGATTDALQASSTSNPAVCYENAVRRLTPRECERLQGVRDNHTQIEWRGKIADLCPDGPRYKSIGNAMALPVMRWIGERINAFERESPR